MKIDYSNTEIMAALLRRLETVTTDSARQMIAESSTCADTYLALNTHRTQTGVSVGNFNIVVEKVNMDGLKKNYYTIVDTECDEVLYRDLSLFESAMSIAKRLMFNKRTTDCASIQSMDNNYDSYIREAYQYKQKLKHISDDNSKRDVFEAKYSNVLGKLKNTKEKILETL
jgi:hypothetical protein|tara:strand:+ start:1812 stop:2324 length:513 start_codon:yes stop_codon:yes gene_type:complete